jgi:hypothetical protein
MRLHTRHAILPLRFSLFLNSVTRQRKERDQLLRSTLICQCNDPLIFTVQVSKRRQGSI